MSESERFAINLKRNRYPFCIVWTPIPVLTWIMPFIGHMGICTSSGIVRDFGGSFTVLEDNMAFGKPTKYWQLDVNKVSGGLGAWDQGVISASDLYKGRVHNLCCDNCHSHVATALNFMQYDNQTNWNMVKLAFLMIIYGKYFSTNSFIKTNIPFLILLFIISLFYVQKFF